MSSRNSCARNSRGASWETTPPSIATRRPALSVTSRKLSDQGITSPDDLVVFFHPRVGEQKLAGGFEIERLQEALVLRLG
jgi:hypothetical protein